MDLPSTSFGDSSTSQIEILCAAIGNLKKGFIVEPSAEVPKFYLEGSSENIPETHIAVHKIQYDLLQEFEALVHVLCFIDKSMHAHYFVLKLIVKYYDAFNCSPLEYQCSEIFCKFYAVSMRWIIQTMKSLISDVTGCNV